MDVPAVDDDDDDADDDDEHHLPVETIQMVNKNGGGSEKPNASPFRTSPPFLRSAGGGGVYRRRTTHAAAAGTNSSHTIPNNSNIQSHNYEPDESEVWRAYTAKLHFANRGQWWTAAKQRSLKRWVLTFGIGVLQAVIATACNFATRWLSAHKYNHVYALLGGGSSTTLKSNTDTGAATAATDDLMQFLNNDDAAGAAHTDAANGFVPVGSLASAFLTFLFYQTCFAAIASFFVWWEPASGGSGIPEIKCFLNGIDLPNIVRMQTLVCKLVGVTFSVAAGFPIGMEGPMVHSGAVVAAVVSQGKSRLWGADNSFSKFSDFRNDREKRDFVACGAAAGVCSAFGSPIGGVLFSLEEASSYFSTKLTW
jgi:chloride channel 7